MSFVLCTARNQRQALARGMLIVFRLKLYSIGRDERTHTTDWKLVF